MSPQLTRLVVFGVCVACGCSASGATNDQGGGDATDDAGDTADSGSVDDQEAAVVWWRLDADLVVLSGLPAVEADGADAGGINVTVLDEDLVEVCSATAPLASAVRVKDLALDGLVDGWSLAAGAWDVTCDDLRWDDWFSPLEGEFVLAFGPLHPEVAAALGGLSGIGAGAEEALNGAYLQTQQVELVAFGAAGPAAAFQGEGSPATAAPLPDGDWYVRGVFGLAL